MILTGATQRTERPRRLMPRITPKLLLERYSLIGIWFLMAVSFSILQPSSFLQLASLRSIVSSNAPLVFIALGAFMPLYTGDFDLSVPFIAGLVAVIIPVMAVLHGVNIVVACLVAVLAAAACGVVNGLVVVYFSVDPFVATLGSGTVLLGIGLAISGQTSVGGLNQSFSNVAVYNFLGLPLAFWYGILLVAAMAYVLTFTPFGRRLNFVGMNREVSRLAGIRVNRVRFASYIVAAILAGLGGLLMVMQLGGFDDGSATDYLLPTFAAVFLGAAVVRPGRVNPIGTVIGAYFLSTGTLGLEVLGYSGWAEDIFYGVVLIVGVAVATAVSRRTMRL